MLEQIVSTKWLEKRPLFSLFLGFAYTLLATITAFIFFRDSLSLSMVFLITLLLLPSLSSILSWEEDIEKKDGTKNFFHDHKDIFEIYLFISIGVVIGYLVTIFVFSSIGADITSALSEQVKVFGGALSVDNINDFSANAWLHFIGIFTSNLGVAIIFFILSFFYGAGAIFLVVWNASIFSTFLVLSLQNISKGINHSLALMGAFSIYFIPEVAGFLLAAIAGGVISKAVIREKLGSGSMRNVIKDATILLLLSFVFLIVAAFLESFAAVRLIQGLV